MKIMVVGMQSLRTALDHLASHLRDFPLAFARPVLSADLGVRDSAMRFRGHTPERRCDKKATPFGYELL